MKVVKRFWLLNVLVTSTLAGCTEAVAPPVDPGESQFIVVKRAWLPGERDSLIARIMRDNSLFIPYVGNLSDLAPRIYSDLDSTTEMVPNPLLTPNIVHGLYMSPDWGAGFSVNGVNIFITDNTQVPSFTWRWSGLYWLHNSQNDRVGFLLAASTAGGLVAQIPARYVYTPDWDRDSATVGAGAGEGRLSLSQRWEARGPKVGATNQFYVTQATFGSQPTVNGGVWNGGTQGNGTMRGRAISVPIIGVAGSPLPATQTVDLNFTGGGGLTATKLVCVFPTPCTSTSMVATVRGLRQATAAAAEARATDR